SGFFPFSEIGSGAYARHPPGKGELVVESRRSCPRHPKGHSGALAEWPLGRTAGMHPVPFIFLRHYCKVTRVDLFRFLDAAKFFWTTIALAPICRCWIAPALSSGWWRRRQRTARAARRSMTFTTTMRGMPRRPGRDRTDGQLAAPG